MNLGELRGKLLERRGAAIAIRAAITASQEGTHELHTLIYNYTRQGWFFCTDLSESLRLLQRLAPRWTLHTIRTEGPYFQVWVIPRKGGVPRPGYKMARNEALAITALVFQLHIEEIDAQMETLESLIHRQHQLSKDHDDLLHHLTQMGLTYPMRIGEI